jgi:hypothetical protein
MMLRLYFIVRLFLSQSQWRSAFESNSLVLHVIAVIVSFVAFPKLDVLESSLSQSIVAKVELYGSSLAGAASHPLVERSLSHGGQGSEASL